MLIRIRTSNLHKKITFGMLKTSFKVDQKVQHGFVCTSVNLQVKLVQLLGISALKRLIFQRQPAAVS